MQIEKRMNQMKSYNISLINNNKKFEMLFFGNLDLYWVIERLDDKDTMYEVFSITKENYEIYRIFEELFDSISECNVFQITDDEIESVYNQESNPEIAYKKIEKLKLEKEKLNEFAKKSGNYKLIYDGKNIIWYSDEDSLEDADILRISKNDDEIQIEFTCQNPRCDQRLPGTICIRFCNSGSRYKPFNSLFMKHYNSFQEYVKKYDSNIHQIHIEEILYQKKKMKSL